MTAPQAPIDPAEFLLEQWRRLMLPVDAPVGDDDLARHLAGGPPVTVDPMTPHAARAASLTLLPGEDRLPLAFRLYTEAADIGLSLAIVELPDGACRLWLLCQPGPADQIRQALTRLQARVRERERIAVVDEAPIPVDPHFDPKAGRWSAIVDVRTLQRPAPLMSLPPDKLRHQASLLARFRPTPRDIVEQALEVSVNSFGGVRDAEQSAWLDRICGADPALGLSPSRIHALASARGVPVDVLVARAIAAFG